MQALKYAGTRSARDLRTGEVCATSARGGFTLIELLAVMALMVLMMSLSIMAFVDFGRDAAIRSSTLQAKAGLSMARQWAISHRVSAYFRYGNCQSSAAMDTRGYYVIGTTTKGGDVTGTNWMSTGILLADEGGSVLGAGTEKAIRFSSSGALKGHGIVPYRFMVLEGDRWARNKAMAITNMLEVAPLTGAAKILGP